jgi:hypothetical protein
MGYFVPPSLSAFGRLGACVSWCVLSLCESKKARHVYRSEGARGRLVQQQLGSETTAGRKLVNRRAQGAKDDLITNLCATQPHQIKGGAP